MIDKEICTEKTLLVGMPSSLNRDLTVFANRKTESAGKRVSKAHVIREALKQFLEREVTTHD